MAGNHNSGRKPLPSEWKVISGAGRHSRHPVDCVEAPKDEPQMPEDVSEAAQWKWLETTELMRQMGTLSIAYSDLLRLYCETWETYTEARKKVRQLGAAFVFIDPDTKKPTQKPNPWERVMRQAQQNLVRMQTELGLTPTAKSRLQVPKKAGIDVRKRHG